MKVILTTITVILVSFFMFSCGDDEATALSYESATTKSFELSCEKIFTCDEGTAAREYMGGSESACVDKMVADNTEDTECTGYDASKAASCISCMEGLSCAAFFDDEKDLDVECPTCAAVCTEQDNEN